MSHPEGSIDYSERYDVFEELLEFASREQVNKLMLLNLKLNSAFKLLFFRYKD